MSYTDARKPYFYPALGHDYYWHGHHGIDGNAYEHEHRYSDPHGHPHPISHENTNAERNAESVVNSYDLNAPERDPRVNA